ncbi:MAG: HEAT repeat domain-containing protein [Planctomycetes bacterium]|nr:HEAT repeat domain-containing protein [Planctomycetota bacterium]
MKSFIAFSVLTAICAIFAAPALTQDLPPAEQHVYTAQEIAEKLVSTDFAVVLKTREELVAAGAKSLPGLLGALKDKNSDIRFMALEVLGEIKDPSAAPDIIALLDDNATSRTSIASSAAKTLGKLGYKEAVPKLVAALKSPDIDLRYESIKALGIIGAPEAGEKLADMLKNKNDYNAKTMDGHSQICAIIEALGNIPLDKKCSIMKLIGEQLANGRTEIESATELSVSYYAAQALKKLTVDYPQEQGTENTPANLLPANPLAGNVETVKKAIDAWITWWHRNRPEIEKKSKEENEPPKPEGPIGPPAPPAPPSENSTPAAPEQPKQPEHPTPPQTPQEPKTPPAPPEPPKAPPTPPSDKK